jgi:hypothetical protein
MAGSVGPEETTLVLRGYNLEGNRPNKNIYSTTKSMVSPYNCRGVVSIMIKVWL